jgi:hypothetical protein
MEFMIFLLTPRYSNRLVWYKPNWEYCILFYKVQAYNASAFSAFGAAALDKTSQGGDVMSSNHNIKQE